MWKHKREKTRERKKREKEQKISTEKNWSFDKYDGWRQQRQQQQEYDTQQQKVKAHGEDKKLTTMSIVLFSSPRLRVSCRRVSHSKGKEGRLSRLTARLPTNIIHVATHKTRETHFTKR